MQKLISNLNLTDLELVYYFKRMNFKYLNCRDKQRKEHYKECLIGYAKNIYKD